MPDAPLEARTVAHDVATENTGTSPAGPSEAAGPPAGGLHPYLDTTTNELACDACGARYPVAFPVSARVLVAMLKAFGEEHQHASPFP